MPSKHFLMNLGSTKAIIEYAETELGLYPVIKFIKFLSDGQVMIRVTGQDEEGIPGEPEMDGVADKKLEAIAEAVSVQFPVNLYPDPL